MLKRFKQILLIIVPALIMPLQALAAEEEHGEHEHSLQYRHHPEVFLGGVFEDGEEAFSVGLTYEYRLTQLFGVGGLWKWVGGDSDRWVAAVPLFIHPYKGLRFNVAPGLEHKDSENEFLFRLGVAYEFEFGRYTITPELNVDTVDGEQALVLGVSFGYLF